MLVSRHSLRAAVAVRFATRSITNTQTLRDADLAIPPRASAPKHDQHKFGHRGEQQYTHGDSLKAKLTQEEFAVPNRRTTLALKSLPLDTTEDDIREAFIPYGDIKAIRLVTEKRDSSVKRAYVGFHLVDHAARAAAAIESGECMIKDTKPKAYFTRFRVVSEERTATLHVLGFGPGTSVNDVRKFFTSHGKVVHAHLGRGPHEAFVDFASPEVAEAVMNAHKRTALRMLGRPLFMTYATPTVCVGPNNARPVKVAKVENPLISRFRRTNPPCPSIFLGRLSRKFVTDDLKRIFGAFSEVQSVELAYHEDANLRMSAIVRFSETEEATAAIEAWRKGDLAQLGSDLRMDYATGLAGQNNPPYHTLRIAGFSGGWKTLLRLLRPFRSLIWHSHILDGDLRGQGLEVAYVEFDTAESATKVKELLHGRHLKGNEKLVVAYAKMDKDTVHRRPGGIWGQDSGGEKWSYGLAGGEEARLAKIKEENRLETVKQRLNLAQLGAMVEYIKPPPPQPKTQRRHRASFMDRLMSRRWKAGSGVKVG